MKNPPISILGIPISNLTSEETIEECMAIIEFPPKDRAPHYLATINLDFLVNAYGWGGTRPRHPELLKVYRESAIAVADGMPLVWLSKWLGSPLKQRITGKELLPELAKSLGNKEKALFLLGGAEKISKSASVHLHDEAPGLRIVGIATPPINIEGPDLVNAFERDALISDQINETHPDLLAINLGNPKQEIWYERVRPRLHVPLAIGVGGTLNVLGGALHSAPDWMKKMGLEWLYRLFQEPIKLFPRYFKDFFKGFSLIFPLVVYHNFNRLLFKLFHPKNKEFLHQAKTLLFLSNKNSLGVIQLPQLMDKYSIDSLKAAQDECATQDMIILDFKNVGHIQPEGFSFLIKIWQKIYRTKKELYLVNISKGIEWLMILHKVWDLFDGIVCDCPDALTDRLNRKGNWLSFYDAIQQTENGVVINFFGPLNNSQDLVNYLQRLTPLISQKNCILDFSYCTNVDNSGMSFLVNLRKQVLSDDKKMQLLSVSKTVKAQMRLAKIDTIFQ